MLPTASIVFPTRARLSYLAVALASVAPQARAHGAEILVIEDDVERPATRALCETHDAAYVALGAFAGINAARNAGVARAQAELICLLDDDVEVWPGWLAALLAGARANPDHDVYGGPIRPRLEGAQWRRCGREPVAITALDLGPHDRDAEFAWGANLALRRRAVERHGGFDPALNHCGDEEDWERRLRAAGGRIRYLAAAGVDHRRAGADARLGSVARAAWHRGYHARRYDERKATAPSPARELRVLVGCVWHTGRHRCGNGIALAAMSAGRIAALRSAAMPAAPGSAATPTAAPTAPAPASVPAPASPSPDFLSGESGTLGRRGILAGRIRDAAADALTAPQRRALRRAGRRGARRRVLVLGVARPENARIVAAVRAELKASHHHVDVFLSPGRAGAGKWENLNAALAAHPPAGYDWLLLVDDDVVLSSGFLDAFVACAERCGFALAQPAHAFASHAAWSMLRRRPSLVARRMRFVEIGPVTAIAARAFADLLPFPAVRMGWGLDAVWSALAAERGHSLGVVDATPVRHLRPVASDYDHAGAVREAVELLRGRPYVTRREAHEVLESFGPWPR